MKKLAVLLLALVVIGFAVYADDQAAGPKVTWNANIWSGLGLVSDAAKPASTMAEYYDYQWEVAGEYRLKMTATAADGNSGLVLRTYTDPTAGSGNKNVLRWKRAYGWAKFAGGMVSVYGGRLGLIPSTPNYSWNVYGDAEGIDGLDVNFHPTDGLDIDVLQPIANNAGKGSAWVHTINMIQFSAGYTAKDLVTVNLGYNPGDGKNMAYMFGGFNLLAVKDLTAYVEFKDSNMGDSDNTTLGIDSDFAYSMGAIGLNLYASFDTLKKDKSLTEYNL